MASSLPFVFVGVLLCLASSPSHSLTDSTQWEDTNATAETNASQTRSQDSFADMIDRALEKEFTENEQTGGEQIWAHFSSFGFTIPAFCFQANLFYFTFCAYVVGELGFWFGRTGIGIHTNRLAVISVTFSLKLNMCIDLSRIYFSCFLLYFCNFVWDFCCWFFIVSKKL